MPIIGQHFIHCDLTAKEIAINAKAFAKPYICPKDKMEAAPNLARSWLSTSVDKPNKTVKKCTIAGKRGRML
jgi:hypothetical protein